MTSEPADHVREEHRVEASRVLAGEFPPLTEEQLMRLARLLRGGDW